MPPRSGPRSLHPPRSDRRTGKILLECGGRTRTGGSIGTAATKNTRDAGKKPGGEKSSRPSIRHIQWMGRDRHQSCKCLHAPRDRRYLRDALQEGKSLSGGKRGGARRGMGCGDFMRCRAWPHTISTLGHMGVRLWSSRPSQRGDLLWIPRLGGRPATRAQSGATKWQADRQTTKSYKRQVRLSNDGRF